MRGRNGNMLDGADPHLAGLSKQALARDEELGAAAQLFADTRREILNLTEEHLKALEVAHDWGLLHAMYERAAGHAGASIVLLSHGHAAAAEALCRTAVEAAVNLYHCSLGDSLGHIMSYFKCYVDTERKQNDLWAKSIRGSGGARSDIEFHLKKIGEKADALQLYETTLTSVFDQIGRKYAEAKGGDWPNIFERFKGLNKEVSYRTAYAALCSQAHNDAEDLLNDFVQGVTQIDGMRERQLEENRNFALYMTLMTLNLFVEASAIYIARFNISPAGFKAIHKSAADAAMRVALRDHPDALRPGP